MLILLCMCGAAIQHALHLDNAGLVSERDQLSAMLSTTDHNDSKFTETTFFQFFI